ncbi:hypothetical protein NKR19_g282 [Coniochaeta hoffmannii]|uniref:Uncharacterized protein n=1 Tax=Coniochaeta hoffmannii TaxID=91930 RepID=A0AA38S9E1_9PEZI|nr:hypothetical protein NKR19_g282 [Coniochaeta hoffmannii]
MSTVTTMTLLCYDQRLKVYVYQDDANGNTWKTHPKRRYGELVPSNRQVWDYDSQLRPRPDLGEHPKPRTWRNIYLTDPRYEVYTPNGMRKKGAMLGIIWRHDHDEGWDVLVDHWPAHLKPEKEKEKLMLIGKEKVRARVDNRRQLGAAF